MLEGLRQREPTKFHPPENIPAANDHEDEADDQDSIATRTDLKPIDLSTRRATRRDRTYDDARKRSQFFDLLRQEQQLQTTFDKTRFFGKAKLGNQLAMVQRDIARQRGKFPELAELTLQDSITNPSIYAAEQAYKTAQMKRLGNKNLNPADQAKRQQLLREIMAGAQAEAVDTLQVKTKLLSDPNRDISRGSENLPKLPFDKIFNELRQLVQHPPRWYQSKDQWLQRCRTLEKDMARYAHPDFAQTYNPSRALLYWTKKLEVLENNNIRPGFFGKEQWEEERQRALKEVQTLEMARAKSSE